MKKFSKKSFLLVVLLVLLVTATGIFLVQRHQKASMQSDSITDTQQPETTTFKNPWDALFYSNHNVDVSERAPYGICIMSISDRGNQVYWKTLEGVNGFELYRSYSKNGDYEFVTDFTDLSKRCFYDSEFDHTKKKVYYKVTGYFEEEDGSKRYTPFSKIRAAKYIKKAKISNKKMFLPSTYTRQLEAYLGWGNLPDATWSSDNEAVATVDDTGLVTAISQGSCSITCTSQDQSVALSCNIVVDRQADDVMEPVVSRYQQDEEGIWYNPNATTSDDATIFMVGDMMCMGGQQHIYRQSDGTYNFNPSYAYIKDFISTSDFAIGNLETIVDAAYSYSCDESYINTMPNCNAPSRYLEAIRYGGFDGVVTANNHSADTGVHGIPETIAQLEKYQLAHTGFFKDENDPRTLLINVNGIKVGYLAYATGYNGKDATWAQEDIDTMLNYYEKEKAQSDIATLRQRGAEYIIVYMHWGRKNNYNPLKSQLQYGQELADMGVDYIVGAHPHLIQEYVEFTSADGRIVPCAYSIGDFNASISQLPGNRDSILLRIRLQRAEDGSIELTENTYIPFTTYTKYENTRYPTIALNKNLNGGLELKNYDKFRERIQKQVGNLLPEYCQP